jgi:hypothetical protein
VITVRRNGRSLRLRDPSAPTKRVWNVCRQMRRFTVDDLVAVSAVPAAAVRRLLLLWRRAAVVHVDNDGYRLARDLGPLPPVETKEKDALICRNTGERLALRDPGTRRVWKAARALKVFTLEGLALVAGVELEAVALIVRQWRRGAIVALEGESLRLVRDLGPKAPRIKGGELLDPNSGARAALAPSHQWPALRRRRGRAAHVPVDRIEA